jgi:hypothetical protein
MVDNPADHKPTPVFDSFKKVFIVTEERISFYVDIEGNFDKDFEMQVEWSSPPSTVVIVRPYLVAFMD